MNKLSRRAFLGASSITALSVLIPPARAQSGSATTVGLSSTGRISIPAAIGGISLTGIQRAVFSRAATQIARFAPTRAAANATLSAVVRTAMTGSARFGIYGLATAAAIGGAYYLWTGDNPLDAVLNLGVAYDGGAKEGLTLSYPCDCSSVPVNGGSFPDSIVMGWFKNNSSCSQGIAYRMAIITNEASHDTTTNPAPTGFQWNYTQTLESGVKYRHFYSTPYKAQSNCSSDRLNLPSNTDVAKTLSTTDKAKLLTQNALDALGISLWTGVGKGSSWTGGGFTGGGGGSFGGGGATGYWDTEKARQQVNAAGKTGSVATIGKTGTASDNSTPSVGDMYDPWTPTADPGAVEYPSDVPFPDDPGSSPTPTPTSGGTPTPTPTSGGSSGGSSSIDWGPAPEQSDPSSPDPMSWMPTPFAAPSLPGSCNGVPYDFSGPLGVDARGTINPCPVLDAARPVVRPISILGWTFYAFAQLLDL